MAPRLNMNWIHRRYCAGDRWRAYVRSELLPEALAGVDLGDHLLELGPGPGLTTEVLRTRVPRLTALELDEELARSLAVRLGGDGVEVVPGSATVMPFTDGRFSAVVCFTMLHHVPTVAEQDRLFAEARRVLRPGGVFAGSDSAGGGLFFRLLHLGDTLNLVDPATLRPRLETAGFRAVEVALDGRLRFRAVA
jgi:SAM-dependent methyltransferase